MRLSGLCVPRQYARLAGIANGGQKCNAFFAKLARRAHAMPVDCMHNRARLYHLHSKVLYHAIAEPRSRYRRPVAARQAVERLMLLDAVLTTPDFDWLTTTSERGAYFAGLRASAAADTPPDQSSDAISGVTPPLPATFPIAVEPGGRAVLLYLATDPWTDAFRSFLQAHAGLLRVAPTWTLRLVFPRPLDRVYDAYQAVIREEFESPLHHATIAELRWYFEHRREAAEGPVHPLTRAFLEKGAQVFGTPRFTQMYQRWLRHGNAVFEGPSSPAITEALNCGRGRVNCVVLPHSYRHLSPLVTHVRRASQGVEKGARRGDERRARPQPPPLTHSAISSTSALL